MELLASKKLFQLKYSATQSYYVYPGNTWNMKTDGENIFFGYDQYNATYTVKLVYADITAYNGGAVPTYANLVIALDAFIQDVLTP